MKTWKDHERFIALRAGGYSIEVSAAKIGISKRTGLNWERQHADSISELQAQGIDQLAKTLLVNREKRLSRLASFLDGIDEELSKRDLANVTTGALVGMKLKTMEVISGILDAKKIEVGGEMNIKGPALVYKQIMAECLIAEAEEVRQNKHLEIIDNVFEHDLPCDIIEEGL